MHATLLYLFVAAGLYPAFDNPNWHIVRWNETESISNQVYTYLADQDYPHGEEQDFSIQEEEEDTENVHNYANEDKSEYSIEATSNYASIEKSKIQTIVSATLNWLYFSIHQMYVAIYSLFLPYEPNKPLATLNTGVGNLNNQGAWLEEKHIMQDEKGFVHGEDAHKLSELGGANTQSEKEENSFRDIEIQVPLEKMTLHGFPFLYAWNGQQWIQLNAGKTFQEAHTCGSRIYRFFSAPMQGNGDSWLLIPFFWAGRQPPDFSPIWLKDVFPLGKIVCEKEKVELKQVALARKSCLEKQAKQKNNDDFIEDCPRGFLDRYTCKLLQDQQEFILISEEFNNDENVQDEQGFIDFKGILAINYSNDIEYWVILYKAGSEYGSYMAHFLDPETKQLSKDKYFILESEGC